MNLKRIACALIMLGGVSSIAAYAQPITRETSTLRATSADVQRRLQDKPFAFRGISLGMTLDEFRSACA